MPHPFQIFSQSDYLIQVVDINSYSDWQTVQIQISWLLEPTDLDLHCLQRQGISGLCRTRVKTAQYTLMRLLLSEGLHCLKRFTYFCVVKRVLDLNPKTKLIHIYHSLQIHQMTNRLFFFYFLHKIDLTFEANCLLCMKCQSILGEN